MGKKQKETLSYSRNKTIEKSMQKTELFSILYVVYYTVAAVIVSLVFSLLRIKVLGIGILTVSAPILMTALISIVPLLMAARSRAPVSVYIIAPLTMLAVTTLAVFEIFSVGLIIFGFLLGILLAFINSGFSLKEHKTVVIIITAACAACSLGYGVYSGVKFIERDGLYFSYENGGYTLVDANPNEFFEVIVPKEINGKQVKSVSPGAFSRQGQKIGKVDIPSGVKVPFGTLAPCENLLALSMEFSNDIYYLYGYDLPTDQLQAATMVPLSLKIIKAYGVSICPDAFIFGNITNLIISDEVIYVGDQAFGDCYALAKVTFGKNVEIVGKLAFVNCYSLLTVDMAQSKVRQIQESAFASCQILVQFALPDTLEYIGQFTFAYCGSLAGSTSDSYRWRIPGNVKFIGDYAFYYSTNANFGGWSNLYLTTPWPAQPAGWTEFWDVLLPANEDKGKNVEIEYKPIAE